MRRLTSFAVAVLLASVAILAHAQTSGTNTDPAKQDKPKSDEPKKEFKGAARVAKKTGHVSNYDEAKVKPYTLPDVLKLANGQPVGDADTWFKQRRPEILKLFQTEIFGRIPDNTPKVRWEVASTEPGAMNGTAIMKKVVGHMSDKPNGPRMNVTMYIPAKATGPVPVILTITFGGGTGGKALAKGVPPKGVQPKGAGAKDVAKGVPPKGVQPKGAGAKVGGDPIAEILGRGWAYATVGYGDIQPDRDNAWKEGVIGLTLKPGQDKPAVDEWGTVSAWTWGISRIVDYFETDKAIDAKCIGIQGHSRLGRTVLWAGAQDERIAAIFASCSGEAGAALARRDFGETVDDMAQNYGFQLGGNYQKWVGRWNDMPVDSHMLIALVAPRALFCNGGTGDQWADPVGEFLGMVAAGPVYKLVGKKDLGVTELPPLDVALIDGDLGWVYHTGGHVATPADWRAFLDFAGRHFKK